MEKVGDFLSIVERQAQGDLERFKQFIESRGTPTGAWRSAVNETRTAGAPGVEAASASRGDSGKAGVSGTAVAAGVAAAGAAVAGVAAATTAGKRSDEEEARPERESDSGDVIAVGPTGGTESTLQTSPTGGPVDTGALSGGRALDDDLAPSGGLTGDQIAVDESGTLTAGVSGDPNTPVEPQTGDWPGSLSDERDPRNDPEHPQRPI